jgi:hypothetical protein
MISAGVIVHPSFPAITERKISWPAHAIVLAFIVIENVDLFINTIVGIHCLNT